jgi:hypothetical protein
MSWLDKYFTGYTTVLDNGSPVPQQPNMNFVGAVVTTNPATNTTTIVAGSGSGGGTTVTTANYTQPAVYPASGDTVVIAVGDASAAVINKGCEVAGGGFYTVTNIAGLNVTVQNAPSAVNASPGAVISSGAVVTFGGLGAPQAGGALNGQALQLQSGTYTPAGMRQVLNVASANPAGDGTTDDWLAIQTVLDSVPSGKQIEVLLPKSTAAPFSTGNQTCTMYALSQPLVVNDLFGANSGNSAARLRGEHRTSVGLLPTWTGAYENTNWLGPLIIGGCCSDTNVPTYVTDTGMTCIVAGYSGSQPLWYINASEFDTGDMIGDAGGAAFCFEFWVNPLSDTPSGVVYELATSYGNIGIENHTTFLLDRIQGTGIQLQAKLTTANGTFTITTAGNHDLTANTLQHVALDYDGFNFRLWINGVQTTNNQSGGPNDPGMTVAATGALVQKWYEEVTFGCGHFNNWPTTNGVTAYCATSCHWGKTRISNISRYTTPFTPSAAAVTCDSHTKLLVDFANATPSSQGFSSRASLATEWIIARTGAQHAIRTRTNMPVWLRLHVSQVPYTNFLEISDLYLYANGGHGIYTNSALFSHVHDMSIAGVEQGIVFENFSYGSKLEKVNFISTGDFYLTANFRSWNVLFGHGAQFMISGPQVSTSGCQTNWHLVHTYADAAVDTCFLTGNLQGAIAVVSASQFLAFGVTVDDENGAQGYASWLLVSADGVKAEGGFTYSANAACPSFKWGSVTNPYVNVTPFTAGTTPIHSFGSNANDGNPVQWVEINPDGTADVIDSANPGPLFIAAKQSFGVHTITFSIDADFVINSGNGDAFYSRYLVASGTISTTRKITWPANPGAVYQGRNNNAHSVNLSRVGSSSPVTVTSGSAFLVQDNGTDLVNL